MAREGLRPRNTDGTVAPSPEKVSRRPVESESDDDEDGSAAPGGTFGGPIITGLLILVMPATVFFLHALCNEHHCLSSQNGSWLLQLIKVPGYLVTYLFMTLLNLKTYGVMALAVFYGWVGLSFLLERIVPGPLVNGPPGGGGGRKVLHYKINGHRCFWIQIGLVIVLAYPSVTSHHTNLLGLPRLPLEHLPEMIPSLFVISWLSCIAGALGLYLWSFRKGGKVVLADEGNTDIALVDYFMGRELNPRIPNTTIDLKFTLELRPGLIGWIVLVLSFIWKQAMLLKSGNDYSNTSHVFQLENISIELILICLFQGVYVWDALYHEPAILSTMDITTDGLGFMLVFGDICWVPLTYSLQAVAIAYGGGGETTSSSQIRRILASALFCIGYFVFRQSNSEKDAFRKDPKSKSVAHLRTLPTQQGRKLLISGWFGLARKINYTGDWLLSLSWCILTGWTSPVGYFYSFYFLILLCHRAWRDDTACSEKYGSDWKKYKRSVPYIFIPYIF